MNDAELYQQSPDAYTAVEAAVQERVAFMRRTYAHLMGAVLMFVLLQVFFFKAGFAEPIARALLSVHWGLVLAAFFGVGIVANKFAHSDPPPARSTSAWPCASPLGA